MFTYHAALRHLGPDSQYQYQLLHACAEPIGGRFRTGPLGRPKPFRFTSFGDQSVPLAIGMGLGPRRPNAGFIVDAVDAADPPFST